MDCRTHDEDLVHISNRSAGLVSRWSAELTMRKLSISRTIVRLIITVAGILINIASLETWVVVAVHDSNGKDCG